MLCLLALPLLLAAGLPARSDPFPEAATGVTWDPEPEELAPEDLEARDGEEPAFDIPIEVNERVEWFLKYFQTEKRDNFTLWLARSRRYIPAMRKILREHGLPEDLVYMALIESGFSTRALSRTRATGPWQFMRFTGKKYGLREDWWVDERRDPEKSTMAAARYLKDLYDLFNSWHLAAAAYNAGEGKILRAVNRYRTEDFWDLARRRGRHMRRETRDYVPKLIAAAMIAKDPDKYGFVGLQYEEALAYDAVSVPDATSLSLVAQVCGVDREAVTVLNPDLRRGITPPLTAWDVKIPKGTGEACTKALAALTPDERPTYRRTVVRAGQTLASIARKYDTDAGHVRLMGRWVEKTPHAGDDAVVEVAGPTSELPDDPVERFVRRSYRGGRVRWVRQPFKVNPMIIDQTTLAYQVQPGDTIWSIASRFNVTVDALRRWNGIRRTIYPGQEIRIRFRPT